MATVRNLIADARDAAKQRGHEMPRFTHDNPTQAHALCTKCGRGVWVDAKPLPNGIDIAGEAVALGCANGEKQ